MFALGMKSFVLIHGYFPSVSSLSANGYCYCTVTSLRVALRCLACLLQERICEESTSFELSSVDLAGAMRELNDLSEKVVDMARQDDAKVDMSDSQAVVGEMHNT